MIRLAVILIPRTIWILIVTLKIQHNSLAIELIKVDDQSLLTWLDRPEVEILKTQACVEKRPIQ